MMKLSFVFASVFILFWGITTSQAVAQEVELSDQIRADLFEAYQSKTVVVTGAANGIGGMLCLHLAQVGANIVAIDINADGLRALSEEISAYMQPGQDFEVKVGDVTDIHGMKQFALDLTNHNRTVDLLINNAGVGGVGAIDEMSPEQIERIIKVNTLGVTLLTRELLPNFRGQSTRGEKTGIIFVSSMLSQFPVGGVEVYAGTKGYVNQFAKGLANEMAAYPTFQVSIAYPTSVDTAMLTDINSGEASFAQRFINRGGHLSPQEVSVAILTGYKKRSRTIVPGGFRHQAIYFVANVPPFRGCLRAFIQSRRRRYDGMATE